MNQKTNIKKLELEYDEFYTQINKLNRISDLPEQISFKVSPIFKFVLPAMILGVGVTGAVYSISEGKNMTGLLILLGSITFYLLLYYTSHRPREKKYIVSKSGITVNNNLFSWSNIDDLHLTSEALQRGKYYCLCFEYQGVKKEFPLDSMTKSIGEIRQILYMYQQWWKKEYH